MLVNRNTLPRPGEPVSVLSGQTSCMLTKIHSLRSFLRRTRMQRSWPRALSFLCLFGHEQVESGSSVKPRPPGGPRARSHPIDTRPTWLPPLYATRCLVSIPASSAGVGAPRWLPCGTVTRWMRFLTHPGVGAWLGAKSAPSASYSTEKLGRAI